MVLLFLHERHLICLLIEKQFFGMLKINGEGSFIKSGILMADPALGGHSWLQLQGVRGKVGKFPFSDKEAP